MSEDNYIDRMVEAMHQPHPDDHSFDFDAFVDGYIECILWCDARPAITVEEVAAQGGYGPKWRVIDRGHITEWSSPEAAQREAELAWESAESGGLEHLEVSDATRAAIIERGQLREFVEGNFADLLSYVDACETGDRIGYNGNGAPESWAGHDFYLTRAGHGAGFWDRGLGELGDRLSEASKGYGSPDDHMLHDNGDGEAVI